jgi:2-hydroxy-6-oxonona-2,4-dienedioate hydrolase
MVPLLRVLAPSTLVYAVDLPGYGRSEDPPERMTLPELSDALGAWMDAIDIGPALVLGHSLGAQIVAHLAIREPSRVTHLVLAGATRDPIAGGPWHTLLRLIVDGPRERFSLLWVGAFDYLRAGPKRMFSLLGEAIRAREEIELARIAAPTLIVRGARDPLSTQRWNERMLALVPHARLVVIADAAHAINYSAPARLADLVLEFARE